MLDALGVLGNLSPMEILMYFVVICICIKAIFEFGVWIFEKLEWYHKKETKKETYEESIEDRISKLESHDKWQFDKITEISNNMVEVKDSLVKLNEDSKVTTVATFRSKLYSLHKEFTTQEYVTEEGLKTFLELGKIYESAGGNDIYHDKLYPEVMKLEIR